MSRYLVVCRAITIPHFLAAVVISAHPAAAQTAVAIETAQVSVSGTSNIHSYTASTNTVRVTRAELGVQPGSEFWPAALMPNVIQEFAIAIPAATLTSPREGLDANLHKALKVNAHPDITFYLRTLERRTDAPGTFRGVGVLQVAGVQREIAMDVAPEQRGDVLTIRGQIRLLMTDFGIQPPTALLGMLRTDPRVTIAFEIHLLAATT